MTRKERQRAREWFAIDIGPGTSSAFGLAALDLLDEIERTVSDPNLTADEVRYVVRRRLGA